MLNDEFRRQLKGWRLWTDSALIDLEKHCEAAQELITATGRYENWSEPRINSDLPQHNVLLTWKVELFVVTATTVQQGPEEITFSMRAKVPSHAYDPYVTPPESFEAPICTLNDAVQFLVRNRGLWCQISRELRME